MGANTSLVRTLILDAVEHSYAALAPAGCGPVRCRPLVEDRSVEAGRVEAREV